MSKRTSDRGEHDRPTEPAGPAGADGVVVLVAPRPAGVRYRSIPQGGEPGKQSVAGSRLPESVTFGAVAAATFTLGAGA
jgi:hypothetical protein